MKKILMFLASLAIGSTSFVSCTDLSEETYSVIPSDEFFNNEEEFLMSAGLDMEKVMCMRMIRRKSSPRCSAFRRVWQERGTTIRVCRDEEKAVQERLEEILTWKEEKRKNSKE